MGSWGESIKIHDPLYELNVFRIKQKERLLSLLGRDERRRSELYKDILSTYELTRLNYLKQAGFSWLVFPSATHTRFTHALGTWTLGSFALEHVTVKDIHRPRRARTGGLDRFTGRVKKLGDWLDDGGSQWREEFLVSLLLHDIGHLPFSHVLEVNEDLKRGQFISHEDLSLDLIRGQGVFYERVKEEARKRNLRTVAEVLREYSDDFGGRVGVEVEVIANLLSAACERKYRPINELVHGVADLDRVDHYNRDSYFMGLKLANINVKGLLENLMLEVKPDPRVSILEEGEAHLLQLLFSRDQLWQSALDNDVVRAYEAMMNQAVSIAVRNGLDIGRVLLMTDDDLLHELGAQKECELLVRRVLAKQPYSLAYKKNTNASRDAVAARFNEWMKEQKRAEGSVILYFSPQFGQRPNKWLYSDVYILTGDEHESIEDRNRDLIRYFEAQELRRRKQVRVYAETEELSRKIEDSLSKDVFRGIS